MGEKIRFAYRKRRSEPQYFHYALDSQENPFPEFFEATRAAANVAKIAAAANYGGLVQRTHTWSDSPTVDG